MIVVEKICIKNVPVGFAISALIVFGGWRAIEKSVWMTPERNTYIARYRNSTTVKNETRSNILFYSRYSR